MRLVYRPLLTILTLGGLLLGSLAVLIGGYAAGELVPWRLVIMGAAPLIQLGLYHWDRRWHL